MLRKILITLATSAVVLAPFSVSASDLVSHQDNFISKIKNLMVDPKNDFTDDPLALEMLKTSQATRSLAISFAVDYCLAKSKGEAKLEDRNQIRRIEASMNKNGTPNLKGAFRSIYFSVSVLANWDMCP